MSVADLDEMEGARRGLFWGLGEGLRTEHAAGERPKDAASRPGHAFEKAAPVKAVSVVIVVYKFCQAY